MSGPPESISREVRERLATPIASAGSEHEKPRPPAAAVTAGAGPHAGARTPAASPVQPTLLESERLASSPAAEPRASTPPAAAPLAVGEGVEGNLRPSGDDPAPDAVPATAPTAASSLPPPAASPERPSNGSGSTSLEPIDASVKLEAWGTGGGVAWLAEYERMARLIAGTVTLPPSLKTPRDILAVAFTGRELGIGFMESTRLIHIIKGTPALAAELKVKLAKQQGHDIRQVEETPESMTVRCVTHESDPASFSLAEARKAGLVKADSGYDKYLPDMMWARSVSRLIRRHCPEVQGASLRSIEEMEPTGGSGTE